MRLLALGLMLGATSLALPAMADAPTTDAVLKTYVDIAEAGYFQFDEHLRTLRS